MLESFLQMRTDRQLSSDNFLRHSKSINRFFLATASTNRPMFVNRNEIKLKFSVQIAAEVLSSRFTKMNRLHRNNCPDFRTRQTFQFAQAQTKTICKIHRMHADEIV